MRSRFPAERQIHTGMVGAGDMAGDQGGDMRKHLAVAVRIFRVTSSFRKHK